MLKIIMITMTPRTYSLSINTQAFIQSKNTHHLGQSMTKQCSENYQKSRLAQSRKNTSTACNRAFVQVYKISYILCLIS